MTAGVLLVALSMALVPLDAASQTSGPSAPRRERVVPRRENAAVGVRTAPSAGTAATRPDHAFNLSDLPASQRGGQTGRKPPVGGGNQPAAPPGNLLINREGSNRAISGSFPPDTSGAVGTNDYVQTTNVRIRVHRKFDGAVTRSENLAAFMGDGDFNFDPQILYDNTWNRFVVLSTRAADSTNDPNRYIRLAISTSSNANGSFFLYRVNLAFNPGEWCDFPKLGMDQGAIIITCNNFNFANVHTRRFLITVAKARLYNGQGFNVPGFFFPASTQRTLAPPLFTGQPMQQAARTFVAEIDSAADVIRVHRLQNTANAFETTLTTQANIPVPAWSAPPLADQPGTNVNLETLDGRFQQHSVQRGNELWLVHTEALGSFAAPRYYTVNAAANTLIRHGTFFRSGTSDDWNASLNVNEGGEVFFTFTSTDAALGVNPEIRFTGCQVFAGDCDSNLGQGLFVQGSASFSQEEFPAGRFRWGDYSQVSLDPSPGGSCFPSQRAWATNQYVGAADHQWDSKIFRFAFCA
jgi:hypothetical protein